MAESIDREVCKNYPLFKIQNNDVSLTVFLNQLQDENLSYKALTELYMASITVDNQGMQIKPFERGWLRCKNLKPTKL